MMNRLLLSTLAVAALFSSGCLFSRKDKPGRESSTIATQGDREFRQRWIARRIIELQGQGIEAAAARQQATQEYTQKFPYTAGAR